MRIVNIEDGFKVISDEFDENSSEISETFNLCEFLKYEYPFVIYFQYNNDWLHNRNQYKWLMVFDLRNLSKRYIINHSRTELLFVTFKFICYAIDNDFYCTPLWYPEVSYDKDYPEYTYMFGDRYANIENNDEYCKEKIIAHNIFDLQKYIEPYAYNYTEDEPHYNEKYNTIDSIENIEVIIFRNSKIAKEMIKHSYDTSIYSNSFIFYKKIDHSSAQNIDNDNDSYDLCVFNYNVLTNFGNCKYITTINDDENRECLVMKQDSNLNIILYDYDDYVCPIYSTKLLNSSYISKSEFYGLLIYYRNTNIIIVDISNGFTSIKEYSHGERYVNHIDDDDNHKFKLFYKINDTMFEDIFVCKNFDTFIIEDHNEITEQEYQTELQNIILRTKTMMNTKINNEIL